MGALFTEVLNRNKSRWRLQKPEPSSQLAVLSMGGPCMLVLEKEEGVKGWALGRRTKLGPPCTDNFQVVGSH